MINYFGYPKVTGNLKANKVQVKVTGGIYMTSWSVDKKTTKRNSSLKRLCATFMSLILCIQLVWCNTLEVKALDVTSTHIISENMGPDEQINFSPTSDYAVLSIDSGVLIESNINISNTTGARCELSNDGTITGAIVVSAGSATINNSGNIATVQASSSDTDLTISSGTFSTVNVSSIQKLTLDSCTINNLSSNTEVSVGTAIITDNLTVSNGISSDAIIEVYETTNITVTNTPITVTCNGIEYAIPAGFNSTIADSLKSVAVILGEGMEIMGDDFITGTYWPGDTTDQTTYMVLPGYTFPANYTSGITSTGSGTVNATVEYGQQLIITYTLAESEASDVTITLPNATPLDPGTVEFTISDIYVGQEVAYDFGYDTVYDTDTATIKYKKNTEDDTSYTTVPPTEVGDYTVLLELPATYDYGAYSQTYSFSIKALEEGLAEISVADISYGETLNPQYSSSTNDTTPTIEYKLQSEDESAYTTTVPTAVGSYDARVTYPATSTHASAVATTTFKINYLPGDGSISVDDVYVGTEINPIYSSEKNGTEHVIIEYKLTTDTEYTTVKPTAVGSYDVRATFPATLIYDEVIATNTFQIKELEEGLAEISVADISYGETLNPQYSSSTNDTTPTIEYKLVSEDTSSYTTTVPTAVGSYHAKVTYPATSSHTQAVAATTFDINYLPGDGSISVDDVYVGTEINPVYSSEKNGTEHVIIEYKLTTDTEYTTVKPTTVGSYNVRATFPATLIYDEVIATDTFEIKALEAGEGFVNIEDVYVGTDISTTYNSDTNPGTPIIEYKAISAEDSEYSVSVPTEIGEYMVRATFEKNSTYNTLVVTDTFKIKALETGTGFVNTEDIYVGSGITTTYNSDTNPGTPIIEYKAISAEDSEYSVSVPTEIGEYMVRATFEKNSTYNTLVVTDTFVIKDLEEGVATVTAEDVIFGLLVSPTFWTSTNQGAKVTILYKEASADDSTYTTTVPSQVGTYTVKAVFEAYGIYKEVVVTDNFTISYLELPEQPYTISGTMGENNIYTSKVEIIPIEGYLISDTLGGNYKESLVYDKTTTGSYVYFKKAATGEMSAGVPLKDFKIDLKAPSINLVNEKVYYGDTLDLSLTDKDISKVVINDETYTKEDLTKVDNKIILDSEGGVTTYTIQIWDMAGNMTEITVVVASEWTKSGIIPVGDIVKLATNKAYTLGEGNWQVEGDSTSYTGNTSFYVSKDGNYKFTQE